MKRIVLHIDMDSFFASVEERDHPRIKGLPIVVGSDPANGKGRGVVSTANYAARAYGIKSALPISRAWRLSQKAKAEGKPEVVFFEPNIKKYAGISSEIFAYIATRGELFEPASIDEAYLELGMRNKELGEKQWERAEKVAKEIQDYVTKNFQLSCSIGVGPNKLIAKIAAGRQKPHGLTVVRESEVQAFLDPLSVRELLGIGPKTGAKLAEIKIETIKELRQLTKKSLVERFGEKTGEHMYESARGIDERPIEENREAKSIGSETTFDVDTLDAPKILATFKELAREVALSVKKEGKRFKTIAIVVRFSDFQTQTRSHTIGEPSDDGKVLEMEGLKLLLPFFDKRENSKHKNIRLVGIRAENLH